MTSSSPVRESELLTAILIPKARSVLFELVISEGFGAGAPRGLCLSAVAGYLARVYFFVTPRARLGPLAH